MPRADIGDKDTKLGQTVKGEFLVSYAGIAKETMKPKDPSSNFSESLRVIFKVDGTEDDTVSLGVSIEDPNLWGFVDNPEDAPTNEGALREFIKANIVKEPIYVWVNGFIRSRLAPEGTHTFTHLIGIWPYQNRKGEPRIGMSAITEDGLTTTWNCKEPPLTKIKGDEPEEDYIGPDSSLHYEQYVFDYLVSFGLKWGILEKELKEAKAYWPGHWDDSGEPVEPLFESMENPWPAFMDMIYKHGTERAVEMEVVYHKDYGHGPRRGGQFSKVEMTPVKVVSDPKQQKYLEEFQAEATLFMEMWDNLMSVVYNKESHLMDGSDLTEDGVTFALAVLKPLLCKFPSGAKKFKDGIPVLWLPPDESYWTLDALVAFNKTAEKLMAAGQDKLFEIVVLSDTTGAKVVEWVEENVKEITQDMSETKGEGVAL